VVVLINAGQLDQRVTLRMQGTAQDALGQVVAGWTDIATLWARVRPVKGREYSAAGAQQALADVEIDIRYRTGLTTAMRVRWRGVDHEILAVTEPYAGRETLRLHCRSDA
jgi:SPP1 family predicted phage head-tail adaptor